jgi:hypothetical protein
MMRLNRREGSREDSRERKCGENMLFTVELLLCICLIDSVWLNVLDMSVAARDLVPNDTDVRETRGL